LKTPLVLVGADATERGVAAARIVEGLDVAKDREPGLVAALVGVPLNRQSGSTAGWAFGFLAAAVALASWANVYHFTDEVANLIDARRSDYKRELRRLKKLSKDTGLARKARATAEAASIKAEFTKRGEAAGKDVEALGKQLLHENPGVAGHGWGQRQARPSGSSESEGALGVSGLPGLEHTLPYEPPPELAADTNHDNGSHEVET
jgi:hypothetical protein